MWADLVMTVEYSLGVKNLFSTFFLSSMNMLKKGNKNSHIHVELFVLWASTRSVTMGPPSLMDIARKTTVSSALKLMSEFYGVALTPDEGDKKSHEYQSTTEDKCATHRCWNMRTLLFHTNFTMRALSSPLFKGPTKHPNCSNIVRWVSVSLPVCQPVVCHC